MWSWVPGSAGCDLNSVSILGIREANPEQFLPCAFQRGLTCGAGVIYEPTLGGHYRPEVLFYHLLHGYNFAESAALSDIALCFVDMAVGDPLYNPHRAGKVPRMDIFAPPQPEITLGPFEDGTKTVRAVLPQTGPEPEVVRMVVEYGASRRYGEILSSSTGYRRAHEVALNGLSGSSFYHFRVRIIDPMGNETFSPDFIFYTREPDPLIAGLEADPSSVPVGHPFTLVMHLSSADGLDRLHACTVTLSVPALGVFDLDVTGLLSSLPKQVEFDPEGKTMRIRSNWPGFMVQGEYLFKLTIEHPSGVVRTAHDGLTVR